MIQVKSLCWQRTFKLCLGAFLLVFCFGFFGCAVKSQNIKPSDNNAQLKEIEKARALVKSVNDYCREKLGYTVFINYQDYKKSTGIKYLFRASPKYKLSYDYSSSAIKSELFDNEAGAKKMAEELKDSHDTYIYILDGHGGGFPLTDSFFKLDKTRQILLVAHEDWHDNINFSYSLEEGTGTLLGYLVAIEILKDRPQDNNAFQYAKTILEWSRARAGVIIKYYALLESLYKQDVPESAKELARQEYFREAEKECRDVSKRFGLNSSITTFNNATFSSWITYDRYLELAYRVYLGTGKDIAKTAEIFRGIKPLSKHSIIPGYFMTEEMIKKYEKEQVEYLEKYTEKAK